MIGSSLSGMSVVLIDSNVVSQLVSMTYDGSAYQVVGSSVGNMGSFTTSITNKAFPTSGSAEFPAERLGQLTSDKRQR